MAHDTCPVALVAKPRKLRRLRVAQQMEVGTAATSPPAPPLEGKDADSVAERELLAGDVARMAHDTCPVALVAKPRKLRRLRVAQQMRTWSPNRSVVLPSSRDAATYKATYKPPCIQRSHRGQPCVQGNL
ncbi:hypothetical protein DIPPA_18875 [Diplonema papillatum]|nr:hypothetical protein DIPPA_18875 [Diplonema papillatum]